MRLPAVRLRRPVPRPDRPARDALPRRVLRVAWRRVPPRRRLLEMVRHNAGLKLVSLLVACFLWYSIHELERAAERTVDLPVAIRRVFPSSTLSRMVRGPRRVTIAPFAGDTSVTIRPGVTRRMAIGRSTVRSASRSSSLIEYQRKHATSSETSFSPAL